MRAVTLAGLVLLLGSCTDPSSPAVKDTGLADTGSSDDTDDTGETGETATDTAETADTQEHSGEDTSVDPPCTAYGSPTAMGVVDQATLLDEISGIAVSRLDPDVLWVHEDHGGEPEVYALDTTGVLLATVTLDGATNNDWEDLSLAPCGEETCIWVGEVGNNVNDREGLGAYRIPEPDLSDAVDGRLLVEAEFFGFVYPDENQNSEAMAVTADGRPLIFTKRFDDETSRIYVYPSMDAGTEVTLEWVGELSTGDEGADGAAAVTGADLWPDDSKVILRTYGAVFELDVSGGLDTLDGAPRIDIAAVTEGQNEAIGYDPGRRGFWQVSEGPNPTLWFTGCVEE